MLVKEINLTASYADTRSLTNVNDSLYVTVTDSARVRALWKSDGTPTGTTLVKPGTGSAFDRYSLNFTNVNGTLFFRTYNALWKSDGTVTGTTAVKDIHVGSSNTTASYLTNVSGTLFFQG